MQDNKLTPSSIEKLGSYVYLLIDPRDKKVFYVGKGKGKRINQHELNELKIDTKETEKIKTIREIKRLDMKVGLSVLRHGLTDKEALEIECAMIDYIGIKNLTNLVLGHHSAERGKMKLSDIVVKYQAEDATFSEDEPLILININKRYYFDITPKELFEATRKHWKASTALKDDLKIACTVYRGIIREVFAVDCWQPSLPPEKKGRVYFEGKVAPKNIRDRYIDKSVNCYWKKGSQNPIKYTSKK